MQCITSIPRFQSREEGLACGFQSGHVPFHGPLDLIKIYSKVGMDEYVPEARQRCPIDFGPSRLEVGAEPLRGLGHRLEIPQHRVLYKVRGRKRLRATRDVLVDSRDATENMAKVDAVVFHSGTASLITRSRRS